MGSHAIGFTACAEKARFAATFATWEIEDFLYIEHFAVKEEYRNGGYGGMLLDALLAEKKRPMVLEVELPEDALTRRRIGFYERAWACVQQLSLFAAAHAKGAGSPAAAADDEACRH